MFPAQLAHACVCWCVEDQSLIQARLQSVSHRVLTSTIRHRVGLARTCLDEFQRCTSCNLNKDYPWGSHILTNDLSRFGLDAAVALTRQFYCFPIYCYLQIASSPTGLCQTACVCIVTNTIKTPSLYESFPSAFCPVSAATL